jgi:RHS repeat-associated protein
VLHDDRRIKSIEVERVGVTPAVAAWDFGYTASPNSGISFLRTITRRDPASGASLPSTTFTPRRELVSAQVTTATWPNLYTMGAVTVPAVSPAQSFASRIKDELPGMALNIVLSQLSSIAGGPVGVPPAFTMYMNYLTGGRISVGAMLEAIWDDVFGTHGTFRRYGETHGLADMNGDGRPDQVRLRFEHCPSHSDYNCPRLKVRLNNGQGMGPESTWVEWNDPFTSVHPAHISQSYFDSYGPYDVSWTSDVMLDFNGDGLADVVNAVCPMYDAHDGQGIQYASQQELHIWFNTGSGFESRPQIWRNARLLSNYYDGTVVPCALSFQRQPAGTSANATKIELMDLDGDGWLDIVNCLIVGSDGQEHCYVSINNRENGFRTPRVLNLGFINVRTLSGSYDTIYSLTDVNADGLPDQVVASSICASGSGHCWLVKLNVGGDFENTWRELPGTAQSVPGVSSLPIRRTYAGPHHCLNCANEGVPIAQVTAGLIDVNVDGLADYVIDTGFGNRYVMYNTGWGFGPLTRDDDSPTIYFEGDLDMDGNVQASRTFDLLGDGTMQEVFAPGGANDGWTIRTRKEIAFPDLIARITNPVGGQLTVDYGISSETNSRMPLLPIVKGTVRHDGVGSATVEYSYDSGWTDASDVERRFHGFRMAQTIRYGSLEDQGTRFDYYNYYVGDRASAMRDPNTGDVWPDGPGLTGRLAAVLSGPAFLTASGRWDRQRSLRSVERVSYSVWEADGMTSYTSQRVYVPRLVKSRNYDIGRNALGVETGRRRRDVAYVYDNVLWNNLQGVIDYGEVGRDGNVMVGNDEIVRFFGYAANTAIRHWIFLPNEERVCAYNAGDPGCAQTCAQMEAGRSTSCLSYTRTFYDDQEFGRVSAGFATRTERAIIYDGKIEAFAVNSYAPDSYGNSITHSGPEGGVTKFAYEGGARRTQEWTTVLTENGTAGATLVSSFQYDSMGRPEYEWTIGGRCFRVTYGNFSRVSSIHSSGPQTKVSPGDTASCNANLISEFTYSIGPSPAQHYVLEKSYSSATESITTVTYYDGLGRPVAGRLPTDTVRWAATTLTYNHFDQVLSRTLPIELTSTAYATTSIPTAGAQRYTYDWAGRLVRQYLKQATGTETNATVFDRSIPWRVTIYNSGDDAPSVRRLVYDARGLLTEVHELDKGHATQPPKLYVTDVITRYKYDPLGNLRSIAPPADAPNPVTRIDRITRLKHDSLGLLRSFVDPDLSNCNPAPSCPRTFEYDKAGRLVRQKDAKGQEIRLSYDSIGRLTRKDYCPSGTHPDGTPCAEEDVQLFYDENGYEGRLTRTTKGLVASSYSYDMWGRRTEDTREIGAAGVTSQVYAASWSYDWLDRLRAVSYPTSTAGSADVALYTYGASGRVRRVMWCPAGVRDPIRCNIIVSNVDYDALGRSTSVDWGNGLRTRTVYGPDQRLQESSLWRGTSALTMQVLSHTSDGNISSINTTDIAGNICQRLFTYDYAGRLTSAVQHAVSDSDANCHTERNWAYAYDRAGNITYNSSQHDSAVSNSGNYIYGTTVRNGLRYAGGPHAVTVIRGGAQGAPVDHLFNYDRNGAMTLGNGGTLTYDYDGRLQSAQRLSSWFTYDALGTRAVSRSNKNGLPQYTRYYWRHFERRDHNGQSYLDRYVMLGDRRIALISDRLAGVRYLYQDSVGSTALTANGGGAAASEKTYAPFGSWDSTAAPIDSADAVPYGFGANEEELGESGTHLMLRLGTRQYGHWFARMMSADSIIPDLTNPQSLNRYTYAYNNPVRYVDPSGHSAQESVPTIEEPLLTVNEQMAADLGWRVAGMRVMMDPIFLTGTAEQTVVKTAVGAATVIPIEATAMAGASAEQVAGAIARVSADLTKLAEHGKAPGIWAGPKIDYTRREPPGSPPPPSGVPAAVSNTVSALEEGRKIVETPGQYIHQPRGIDGRFRTFRQRQLFRSPWAQAIPIFDRAFDVYDLATEPGLKSLAGAILPWPYSMATDYLLDPASPCVWGNPCY